MTGDWVDLLGNVELCFCLVPRPVRNLSVSLHFLAAVVFALGLLALFFIFSVFFLISAFCFSHIVRIRCWFERIAKTMTPAKKKEDEKKEDPKVDFYFNQRLARCFLSLIVSVHSACV